MNLSFVTNILTAVLILTAFASPVIAREADLDPQDSSQSFWLGTAGLLGSLLFDQMNVPPARTASYLLWGGAWSVWLGQYGHRRSLQNGGGGSLAATPPRESCDQLNFHHCQASTQGAIGEMSNLHLIPDGFYIHPIYNDVNGNTDKLLTASAKFGYLKTIDRFGFESVGYWRFLTPSYQPEFEAVPLEVPEGRFADWGEWKNSASYSYMIGNQQGKTQLTVGYSDVGNKGGREVHRAVHKITRNKLDNLEYTNQPAGRFFTVGFEQGLAGKSCIIGTRCIDTLISLQGETGRFMTEAGIQLHGKQIIYPKWWEQAFEVRLIRQISSEVYENIRPWRYEVSAGVRVFENFTPSVKHISSYLKGDSIGQTYVDILHYNVDF